MVARLGLIILLAFSAAVTLAAPTELRAADPVLSKQDREHYKNAFLHYGKKRYRDAVLHAKRARNQIPAKAVRWLVLTSRDSDPSFKEARAFLEQNPLWPRQKALRAAVERSMPWSLPDAEILEWFAQRPPVSVEGAMKLAGALVRAGQREEAIALIRETWREGDFDREQEKNFHKRYRKHLTRQDHIARLDNLLWRRGTHIARRQARRIGGGYPALAEARILLAYRKPGVDSALRRVPKDLRRDPGLLFDRASWRRKKGRADGVIEILRPLGADQPRPQRWWSLRAWAAREAMEDRRYKVAYQIARRHGLESGSAFAEAEWLAGWVAYRFLKDPKRAYRHFTRLYYGSVSPISRGRGGYWAGLAAAAAGNADWSTRWYKAAAAHATSFYGQLAAARLGRPVVQAPEDPGTPSTDERARFARQELAQVAAHLGSLGKRDTQRLILSHLGDLAESPEEYVLAAELAKAQGRPDVAIRIAKKARSKEILLREQLFPLPFKPDSDLVEPALVLAVTRQESQFDTRAVSPAGARGLMQLMPATAKKVAKRAKAPYSKSRLTRDPDYNIHLGSRYLASLLDRYGGNHILALAAYNAGPSRVRRWIAAHGDPRKPEIDAVNWIERIPFSETRNYVMRVLESLVVYRQRLNTGIVKLPLELATADAASMQ